MFLFPGYPILCGAFFSTLGLFKSFEYAREANDIVFSALLPISKQDVVKGRYCFVCLIELCTSLFAAISVLFRMTVLSETVAYRNNALMNANLFALGAVFFIFGIFNLIFVGGFFKTAYRLGKPFIEYMIAAFLCITVFETLHHIPELEQLNAFGIENIVLQMLMLICGIALWFLMTVISYWRACLNFEKINL